MSPDSLLLISVLCLILLASTLQRMTGLGFAMMTGPFLVVLFGPHAGVLVTNLLTAIAPMIVIPFVWRDIEWRKITLIGPIAILVMPFFGWLTIQIHAAVLYIAVAALVLLGLTSSLIFSRSKDPIDGKLVRVLTGVGVGGGVVLAGVGGPAITIFAILSRWDMKTFAATMQPLWAVMAIAGFTTKLGSLGWSMPAVPVSFWLLSFIAIVLGFLFTSFVSKLMNANMARYIVIVLAFIGSAASMLTGLYQIV